jgi:hypothetical protein
MTMTRILPLLIALLFAIAGTLMATCSQAQDAPQFDIDAKFRAKIAKEKAKQAAGQSGSQGGSGSAGDAQCGSQSIGNVNTNGQIGSAPREVFVFAPNAINLVNGRGCN